MAEPQNVSYVYITINIVYLMMGLCLETRH